MDASGRQRSGRGLTLALSIISLTNNTLLAIALQYLPTDPLHLITSLALYSIYAAIASFLGLFGILKNSTLLLTIFFQHLLTDALLSNIARFLLIHTLTSFSGSLCVDLDYEGSFSSSFPSQDQCQYSVWALQGFFTAVLMGLMGIQWLCALRIRRYTQKLVDGELRTRLGNVDIEVGAEKRTTRPGL